MRGYTEEMRVCLVAMVMTVTAIGQGTDADGTMVTPNGMGRTVWKRKGIWKMGVLQRQGQAAGTGDVAVMTETLNGLAAIYQATPTGQALTGWWMQESRGYFGEAGKPFDFAVGFFPFYLFDRKTTKGFEPDWSGETESVYFHFNRMPGAVKQPVLLKDGEVGIYPRPVVTERLGGYPVYDGDLLVVTRGGRDPWMAVTVERALRAAMPLLEKDRQTAEQRLAGLRKTNEETQAPAYEAKMRAHLEKYSGDLRQSNPGKWQGRVEGMERELKYNREQAAKKANPQRDAEGAWYWNPVDAHAEAGKQLAALTPAEGKRAACFAAGTKDGRYAFAGRIQVVGAAGCVPLATENTGYFEVRLGRAAPQILVANTGRCNWRKNGRFTRTNRQRNDLPPQGCEIHVPIWEEMVWGRVGGLLAP